MSDVSLPLDVRIAVRLSETAFVLAFLVGLSFAPIGYFTFGSPEFALFSVTMCTGYLSCAFIHSRGWITLSRMLFILLMCIHYGVVLSFVGPFLALETLIVCIAVTPLLIFAKSENRLTVCSYIVMISVISLAQYNALENNPWIALDQRSRDLAYYSNVLCVLFVMTFLMYTYSRASMSNYMKLQTERKKSDELLRELLPDTIADQVIRGDQVVAQSYGECTVLFADLVGFTQLSEKLSPIHLVELLNDIFTDIDRLADKFGVEKIKTIGDCYMAAAGALPGHSQPADMARVGLGIVAIVRDYSERTGYPLAVRVGINTGQVVSGLIGKKRRMFDVWGQTVNIAQMMEANCESGRVLVSESTRWRLQNSFRFSDGLIVTNKSGNSVNAYFLEEEKNELDVSTSAAPALPLMQ